MSMSYHTTRALRFVIACIGCTVSIANVARAQATPSVRQQSSVQFSKDDIADQLGAKMGMSLGEEFAPGSSLTGTLKDPSKLAKFGITGMHEGARVSAMRVSQDKVRVEVDELEPIPQTKKATLKLDEKGRLSAP